MFIQNQCNNQNHGDLITQQIEGADEALFVVAYVRDSGVGLILENIKNKKVKLLCSLDMGITQLSAIKKLLENNVEVRFFRSHQGTFHPKIWFFRKDKTWKMIIGSANLTGAAFLYNVEASVLLTEETLINEAKKFCDNLWKDTDRVEEIELEYIQILQKRLEVRKTIKSKTIYISKKQYKNETKAEYETEGQEILFEYVKSWIDIPIGEKAGIGKLWRGWYIVPDQYIIDDNVIKQLASYLKFIDKDNGIDISPSSNDTKFNQLLAQFSIDDEADKKQLLPRELFVRRPKNYIKHFGWWDEHNSKLYLTNLGKKILDCGEDIAKIKTLYSGYYFNYIYNGLNIIPFTINLLEKLDYLTFDEFNYFVIHTYNQDELDTVVNLIQIYRTLSDNQKTNFQHKFKSYFDKEKEPTGKSVYGNYKKKIKYTLKAIAWCKGFLLTNDLTLSFSDETQ